MSNKNGLANFRIEVNALLKRRSRFVDPRSFNGFERNVFTQQRKNLENLKLVLKGIKKLNVVLTKKNFKEILEKLNEAFKVTIYGNYITVIDDLPRSSREALQTFTYKGHDEKKLMKVIERRETQLMQDHYQTDDYYDCVVRRLIFLEHEISPVAMRDIPLSRIPMRNASVLHRDWLKYAEGISKQAYEDMKGLCVYELLSKHLSNPAKRI